MGMSKALIFSAFLAFPAVAGAQPAADSRSDAQGLGSVAAFALGERCGGKLNATGSQKAALLIARYYAGRGEPDVQAAAVRAARTMQAEYNKAPPPKKAEICRHVLPTVEGLNGR